MGKLYETTIRTGKFDNNCVIEQQKFWEQEPNRFAVAMRSKETTERKIKSIVI